MKPRIGLTLGDPCGIGPELVAKVVADQEARQRTDILVIGDRGVFDWGCEIAGRDPAIHTVSAADAVDLGPEGLALLDAPKLDPAAVKAGRVSEKSGVWQLECLRLGVRLCREGTLDALCFAPLNKEAMHLGGLQFEDESGCLIEAFGHTGRMGLLNTLGNLWTSRVTSHLPLMEVSRHLTQEAVCEAIRLLHDTLKAASYAQPRLAVAGLNPHAGDGGNFGHEEIDTIAPAVEEMQRQGVDVQGPFPPDTIFLKGRDGVYDAIVTMFHDQGQIAMKLMGFDHGVTVHAGLPKPVTTSAHGSAYDIVGRNIANPEALRQALLLAASMAANS